MLLLSAGLAKMEAAATNGRARNKSAAACYASKICLSLKFKTEQTLTVRLRTSTGESVMTSCNSSALKLIINFGLTLILSIRPAFSQPDNRYDSESITLAIYEGYEKPQTKEKDCIKAYYRVYRILKGPPCGRRLSIRVDIDQNSTSIRPKKQPVKGSQWILFIPSCVPKDGMCETFQGAEGRVECSEANLEEVLTQLAKEPEREN